MDVNWPTNPGERWPASAARSSADGLARETRRKMEVTDLNRHLKGGGVEIGCVVHCNIIWLPSLLYCHVLVAKPFEVVSLKAAIAVRQKQEIY